MLFMSRMNCVFRLKELLHLFIWKLKYFLIALETIIPIEMCWIKNSHSIPLNKLYFWNWNECKWCVRVCGVHHSIFCWNSWENNYKYASNMHVICFFLVFFKRLQRSNENGKKEKKTQIKWDKNRVRDCLGKPISMCVIHNI